MSDVRECSVEGCGRRFYGRNLCARHYLRWWRTGSPTGTTRKPRIPNHGSESEYTNHSCRCDACRVGTMRARMLRRLRRPKAPDYWDLESKRRLSLAEAVAAIADSELLALIKEQDSDDRRTRITRIAERSLYEPIYGDDVLLIDAIAADLGSDDLDDALDRIDAEATA